MIPLTSSWPSKSGRERGDLWIWSDGKADPDGRKCPVSFSPLSPSLSHVLPFLLRGLRPPALLRDATKFLNRMQQHILVTLELSPTPNSSKKNGCVLSRKQRLNCCQVSSHPPTIFEKLLESYSSVVVADCRSEIGTQGSTQTENLFFRSRYSRYYMASVSANTAPLQKRGHSIGLGSEPYSFCG